MTRNTKDNTGFEFSTTNAASIVAPSRRRLLQMMLAGLCAGLVMPMLPELSGAAIAARASGGKVLIVYYSRTGNTRHIARHIQTLTGGDMVELETVNPYPEAYRATTQQAKLELETGYKPPLKTKINNISAYDVIFVGSPNWWSTVAAPVKTFLSDYDLSGKTVAPFITHAGSELGKSLEDIRKLCPKAVVMEGLAVRGNLAESAQDDVAAWLRTMGMGK